MNKSTTKQNQNQFNSRREILASLRLSHLPSSANRDPHYSQATAQLNQTAIPICVKCVGCGGRLAADDSIHQRFSACHGCAAIYGRVDAAAYERERINRRNFLNKIGGQI